MEDVFKKWEVLIQAALLRTKMAVGHGSSKNENIKKEDIIKQAKRLINDYIDDRLIRSGLNMKQRKVTAASLLSIKESLPERKGVTMSTLRTLVDKRNDSNEDELSVEEVSKVLICVGEYLELRHNGLYTDVFSQLNVRSIVETNLNLLFTDVAQEIFSSGITWAKVVSLFAFAGGMAVDCVLGGSSMHVGRLKIWTNEFVQSELLEWIQKEGGWIGMFDFFMTRDDPEETPNHSYLIVSGVVTIVCVILTAIVVFYFRR